MNNFRYDIAISLCKQDIEFARALVKSLNPGLKLFFYEERQDELISKSGPEKFASIFKEESRIVVILSRKEWSESYYTDIERNAIIDRTAVKNEGYSFLFMVPMERNEVPSWYPSTQLYADPKRFTVDELARFLEFKVTELGGNVKPITLEDRFQNLLDRIEEKKKLIALQKEEEALEANLNELKLVKELFDGKIAFLSRSIIDKVSCSPFSGVMNEGTFSIGDFFLDCKIKQPYLYGKIQTTQDSILSFEISKRFGYDIQRKPIEREDRLFYYSKTISGWSVRYLEEQASNNEMQVLFSNRRNEYYNLQKPVTSESLVDYWFQKLLIHSTTSIDRYL